MLRAVRSLLGATGEPPAIIIVDQSRSDATQEAVEPYLSHDRVRYVRSDSRGLSAARNVGLAVASTEIVGFTDDDCEVDPGMPAALARAFRADPRIAIVFGAVRAAPHDRARGFTPAYPLERTFLATRWTQKHHIEGMGACMAVRKSVCERLGGFDERFGAGSRFKAAEETDLVIRALQQHHFVYETPELAVVHHGFRTHDEGPVLVAGYLYGLGAMYGKHLHRTPINVLVMMSALAWRWLAGAPVIDLGRPQPKLARLAAFGRGLRAGLAVPFRAAAAP